MRTQNFTNYICKYPFFCIITSSQSILNVEVSMIVLSLFFLGENSRDILFIIHLPPQIQVIIFL